MDSIYTAALLAVAAFVAGRGHLRRLLQRRAGHFADGTLHRDQRTAPAHHQLLNSLVLSLLSVVTFALAGAIAWGPALLMMVAATAGGYAGAHWSKKLPVAWVRALVVVTGLVMNAAIFYQG